MAPSGSKLNISKIPLRPLLLAVLVNAAMGIIYVWSLFLLPMEAFLSVSRSTLSWVPACSLVCFTLGMVVHDRLLRTLSFKGFALIAFGLAGGGHLLFALGANLAALLIGYGALFGFGSGLGYGLALALVTQMPATVRGTAMGLVMAAFAISGVALSSLLANPIQLTSPVFSFMVIGIIIVVLGAAVALLLPPGGKQHVAAARETSHHSRFQDVVDFKFLKLGLVFFFICYTGLTVVAHATGIISARGLSQTIVGLAPGTFTLGYIVGSFGGGKLVEVLSGKTVLVLSNILAGVGLLIFLMPASPFLLTGMLAIGAVFGGSASLMPVLIGEQYGPERIGDIYGKLMVAYGTAGLIAPWVSGKFFSVTGSYTVSIAIAVATCLAGIVLGLSIRQAPHHRRDLNSP